VRATACSPSVASRAAVEVEWDAWKTHQQTLRPAVGWCDVYDWGRWVTSRLTVCREIAGIERERAHTAGLDPDGDTCTAGTGAYGDQSGC
jgi:hypothetical protein